MLKKLLSLVLLCSLMGTAMAQVQDGEAKLKAAFIYNFTKYIEWDTTSSANDFIIGIMGSSPITAPLMEIANTNSIKNKKILIRLYNRPEDIGNCDILFIPQKLPYQLHSILDKTGRGVLTISEEEGSAKEGTAFNFVIRNDKLKFEANLNAIRLAGLKAGSQLLKLAIPIE
jgi:YfiR/HmsC-like